MHTTQIQFLSVRNHKTASENLWQLVLLVYNTVQINDNMSIKAYCQNNGKIGTEGNVECVPMNDLLE